MTPPPPPRIDESDSDGRKLVALLDVPAEIMNKVAGHLATPSMAELLHGCKYMRRNLGTASWVLEKNSDERNTFLSKLAKDRPEYYFCESHSVHQEAHRQEVGCYISGKSRSNESCLLSAYKFQQACGLFKSRSMEYRNALGKIIKLVEEQQDPTPYLRKLRFEVEKEWPYIVDNASYRSIAH